MALLEVVRSVEIERDAEVVRRQFGDVAHHAAAGLHRGVVFEVIEDDWARCYYRQVSKVGPLKFRQKMTLDRTESGPLVDQIVAGQFTGGAISYDVRSRGEGRAVVEARVMAPIPLAMRVVTPILRAQVGKQLAAALVKDKADLEGGAYGQAQQTALLQHTPDFLRSERGRGSIDAPHSLVTCSRARVSVGRG